MTALLLLDTKVDPVAVTRYERRAGGKVKATHTAEFPGVSAVSLKHLNEFLKTPEAFTIWQPDQTTA